MPDLGFFSNACNTSPISFRTSMGNSLKSFFEEPSQYSNFRFRSMIISVQVWVAGIWLVSRCFHQLGSKACAWGYAVSTAVLVSLILAMMTSRKDPVSKSYIGATRAQAGSGFG